MHFTQRLRPGIERGEITCSVRIWLRPRVTPGRRYAVGNGQIEVDSIEQIALEDITPQLARESGFDGVVDLLKIAKHGRGTNVYLVRFHYIGPETVRAQSRTAKKAGATTPARGAKKKPAANRQRQRKRILELIARLPGAQAIARGTHLSLEVRKKRFGYFLDDHHGDGRIALNCKSSPDLRDTLQQEAPAQFHIPKYVGSKGWIGLWLDVPHIDWDVTALALREAYMLAAPKKLTGRGTTRSD